MKDQLRGFSGKRSGSVASYMSQFIYECKGKVEFILINEGWCELRLQG